MTQFSDEIQKKVNEVGQLLGKAEGSIPIAETGSGVDIRSVLAAIMTTRTILIHLKVQTILQGTLIESLCSILKESNPEIEQAIQEQVKGQLDEFCVKFAEEIKKSESNIVVPGNNGKLPKGIRPPRF